MLAILSLPSIPQYVGIASSMTPGLIAATLVALMVLATHGSVPTVTLPRGKAWLAALPVGILGHYTLIAISGTGDHARFALSYLVLLTLGAAAVVVSKAVFRSPPKALHRALTACYAVMTLFGYMGLAGLSPPSPVWYPKPVFPFTEPSHFALAYVPLMAYVAVMSRGPGRYGALALGVALGYGLQNLTLLAGTALAFLICARPVLLLASLPVIWFGTQGLDLEYFALRLDFSGEVQNVSNLAFVQGWQMMGEAIEKTSGYGLGFQQMGLAGTQVDAANVIHAILGEEINLHDGSFTLSKLVSEFGAAGVALALLYVLLAAKLALSLRAAACRRGRGNPADVFACAAIVFYSLELFVRGAGYFTGTGLLFVTALFATPGRQRGCTPPVAGDASRAHEALRLS